MSSSILTRLVAVPLGLLVLLWASGCQSSLESRAESVFYCLDKNGIHTGGYGHGTSSAIETGSTVKKLEEGDVQVKPHKGEQGPHYTVLLYGSESDTEDGAVVWHQFQPNAQVLRLADGHSLMVGSGVERDRAVVERCIADA
jgi:hypothetical protein